MNRSLFAIFSQINRSNSKGQTLIEVIVALGVIALVATAITTVMTSTLNNAEFSNDQSLATKYAQEAMEILHSVRDNNYTQFAKYNGNYCLNQGEITLTQGNCSTPTIVNTFIRTVTINQASTCGANSAQVTVSVAWTDGKCAHNVYCHASILISCLSTVNPVTGP